MIRSGRWIVGGALLCGCVHPRAPLVVSDPDPSVKIPATEKAVQEKDRSVVPQLIQDLQSDDPAVRLFASQALLRLTGQTMGYRYYDKDDQRELAVARWQKWVQRQAEPATTAQAR